MLCLNEGMKRTLRIVNNLFGHCDFPHYFYLMREILLNIRAEDVLLCFLCLKSEYMGFIFQPLHFNGCLNKNLKAILHAVTSPLSE